MVTQPGKQVVNGLKNGLRTLPYVGGKSNFGGPGAWIAEILEQVKCKTYVEPCMGTLGILLRRDPVQVEICNDSDRRIVNFFRVVRDKPGQFSTQLRLTAQRSEVEFKWAKAAVEGPDSVMSAVACFIVLKNSIPASLIQRSCYTDKGAWGAWRLPDDVYRLADRLNTVRFVCSDAMEIMDRLIRRPETLIYVDPPYPGTLGYDQSLNEGELMDALLSPKRKASVAVSGFSDSWPALEEAGFHRHDRQIHLQMDTAKKGRRTESLYVSWGIPLGTML